VSADAPNTHDDIAADVDDITAPPVPDAAEDPRTPSPRRRLARLATEVLAPWVWVLLLPLAIAWHATDGQVGPTLLWGLIVGITGSVIPMIVIVRGARTGEWDSHHVTNREGRVVPFAACLISLGVGWVVLLVGDAPHQMIALAAAMFAALVICTAITFAAKFKVSMHAAVAAGAVGSLMAAYSPWMLLLGLAVVLVCWSRVELGDHTTREVSVGAIVGVLTGGVLYWALELALRA